MKLCMIRLFADGIEHLQMAEAAETTHVGARLRTVTTDVNINTMSAVIEEESFIHSKAGK